MKITGGEWNGRSISAPEGMVTRPTTDLVRGAIFNTLNPMIMKWNDIVLLDGFAGSGAMTFEALSRGAHQAVLVESDQRAFQIIQKNVAYFGVKNRVTLKRTNLLALSFNKHAYQPFNLVFLDPPYDYPAENVGRIISFLVESGVLKRKAIVVYEHSPDRVLEIPKGFTFLKENPYGSTVVTYLQYDGVMR
ncbi:MAG: 16S rRNA (guanine(966)-N(2))-methyltransferase RsmD [Actinomycetia bacterium]|nr:16S rRNA (guanine(966)-N(2))-methyltransferase RsmD [Actinomycetes bacterium]